MLRNGILLCALAAFICVDARGGDAKKPGKHEGAWVGTKWQRGDKEVEKDKIATELVLGAGTYEFPTGINRISKKGSFKADADKGTIDFMPEDGFAKGKTLLGIFKVEGDVLTLCFASAGMDRPKEFKTAERTTVLAVYQRKVK